MLSTDLGNSTEILAKYVFYGYPIGVLIAILAIVLLKGKLRLVPIFTLVIAASGLVVGLMIVRSITDSLVI